MEFSLKIDDRILDGFCSSHFYTLTAKDDQGNVIPNPETKQMFLQRLASAYISDSVFNAEKTKAILDADFNLKDYLSKTPDALNITVK